MRTLKELVEHAADFARETFDSSGELMPMWLGQLPDGEIFPIVGVFDAEKSKDRIADEVRAEFQKAGVESLAFMSEAWTLNSKKLGMDGIKAFLASGMRVSESPDRIEAITIIAEDNRGHALHAQMKIERSAGGKGRLLPIEWFPEDGKVEGRFTNMLAKVPVH